jgi:F-type H+-transporting ATPase subunit a
MFFMRQLLRNSFIIIVLAFAVPSVVLANENPAQGAEHKNEIDAKKTIFEHIMDAYEFHFFSAGETHATIPLPMIIYEAGKGLQIFSSSKFHHGHEAYNGYRVVDEHYYEKYKGAYPKLKEGQLIAVDAADAPNMEAKFYDFSLTRNAVQLIIASILLIWLLTSIAKKYKKGIGTTSAPKGFFQNAIEPLVTFVRDDIAKANIGKGYEKYTPTLLTIFFFILINNLLGLIPGFANVTGNISFPLVLGIVAFLLIIFSTTKYFWGHIFNPPVPGFVKPILVPVEFLGIFTKPVSLIVRLFANMVAGHIIIICFISLIFIFGQMNKGVGWAFSPVSVAFTVFIYCIEFLVAFIQAYIFTNLVSVFIGQSREEHHHEEHHDVAHAAAH